MIFFYKIIINYAYIFKCIRNCNIIHRYKILYVEKKKNKADTKLEIISKNELLELLKVFNDSKLIEKKQ